MPAHGEPSCRIAVLTYLRPDDLAELIPLLLVEASGVANDVGIVVVDNDPSASARHLVEGFADEGVVYVHEPNPGIAAARNTAMASAPDADLLVFIDDDERPVSGWLEMLVELYTSRRPAAVVGPVISRFDRELDPWLRKGRFFDRRRLPTGTAVDVAATNNLLLDLHTVRLLGLRFDERFSISGGSDTVFTRSLVAAGGTILWHDGAIVEDVVPESRQTRAWVLQRAFRIGNSWSRTALVIEESAARRVVVRLQLTASGFLRVMAGAFRLLVGLVTRSIAQDARGHRTLRRGLGMLSGAWGHRYLEYRRPSATPSVST